MLALAALAATPLGCTRRSHGAHTVRFWAVGREGEYAVDTRPTPELLLARATLPRNTVIVLPGS